MILFIVAFPSLFGCSLQWGMTSCGDVAADLVPTMPPECSHNKQGRKSSCDIEPSTRLSTSHSPPTPAPRLQQKSAPEPQPRLPVLDNSEQSLLTSLP